MKPIEIEITAGAGDALAISIDYVKRGAPVIRRWYAKRSVVEAIGCDLDELFQESLKAPVDDAEAAEARQDIVKRLRSLGLALFQEIMQAEGDHLRNTMPEVEADGHIVFKIDKSLAHLPVEVMYDGSRFLSERFAIGRTLYAEAPVPRRASERPAPYSMLIVGDPSDDPAIREDVEYEIDAIKRIYSGRRDFSLKIAVGREVDQRFMLRELPGTTVFHFSGHGVLSDAADRTGIQLRGGHVLSGRSLLGLQNPPSLVFFNMCTAASRLAWKTSLGLAETLLGRGTRSCIASLWDLRSRSATAVAASFHDWLLKGETFGEALRQARLEAMRRFGVHDLTWAAYTLYGNPALRLIPAEGAGARRARVLRHLAVACGIILLAALLLFPTETHREDFGSRQQAAVGYVLVESTPGGARVYIDGDRAGITPFAVEVPIGGHRVGIEKPGYRRWEGQIEVRETPRTVVQAYLEKLEP